MSETAYAFAYYRTRCVICGVDVKRYDGIGLPAEGTILDARSKGAWAHALCADREEREHRRRVTQGSRDGFASRTGRSKATSGLRQESRASARYIKGKYSTARVAAPNDSDLPEIHVIGDLLKADRIVGYGLFGGVLEKACVSQGIDVLKVAGRVKDINLLARLADPRSLDAADSETRHSLLSLAKGLGGQPVLKGNEAAILVGSASTVQEDLRRLLQLDVVHAMNEYGRREHRIAALAEVITHRGFRVDEARLAARLASPNSSNTLRRVGEEIREGRVHTSFDSKSSTGRLSTRCPNLGNLTKCERDVLIAEPGHRILTVDLAQIDARVVAGLSQDIEFLKLFEGDRDIHAETALRLFGDHAKRDLAKRVVHGLNFGMGGKRLAEETGLTLEESKKVVRDMAESFPQWAAWRAEVTDRVRRGERLLNGFGRALTVPRKDAATKGPARLAQSTARDIFFEGVLRIDDAGLSPYLRMLLHDEVVMSVPVADYSEIQLIVIGCLTGWWTPSDTDIPVEIKAVAGGAGRTWADADGEVV